MLTENDLNGIQMQMGIAKRCLFKRYDDHYRCDVCGRRSEVQSVVIECQCNEMPSLATRAINFAGALATHLSTGMKTVSEQIKNDRYTTCRACHLFKLFNETTGDGACTHGKCGCSVNPGDDFLNKIAWADQECPISKWGKSSE